MTAAEVILSSPWEAASMAIGDLLMSQRRWGGTRCRKFLAMFRISETKTIGSLTERQRRALAAQLARTRAIERDCPPVATTVARGSSPSDERAPRAGRGRQKPGPRVAISTMCPSGSRR